MNASADDHSGSQASHGHGGPLVALAVSALGVVFGDIGTSPLYTIQEAFTPHYQLTVNHDTVLGLLSLIIWAIVFVVTLKYVAIIMRADNEGEGGIMALMALAQRALGKNSKLMYWMGILGIFGASLFFGDGVITPSMSVLSAVEGLNVATPTFSHYVLPITLVILVGLFVAQRYGTARVGRAFGPVVLMWFTAIALLGIWNIRLAPEVLKSLNPWWGVKFFLEHGVAGFSILGAVVLAVTGGEALYADMGHFGVRPIRIAWYFVVQPCLILNYMGQGALVLSHPSTIGNPFYQSVPKPLLIPMVVLATMATIIASQAVITGAFSMARSAMQLGYIPRMQIRHTSRDTIGQIYVPAINWTLLLLVIAVVIGFGSATRLATAYGVSVTGTMLMTSILMIVYLYNTRKIPPLLFWPVASLFVLVDVAFLSSNLAKFMDGAWFPLLLGLIIFTMMRTWRRGRELLREEMQKDGIQLDTFLPGLMLAPPVRVEGTAIFLTADKTMVPHAFLHNLKHNRVLHARNIFLTVATLTVPVAPRGQRLSVQAIGDDFYRVIVRFGFMETPDVPRALMELADCSQMCLDPMETTYFASRERIIASRRQGMPIWRDKLFAFMMRNAAPASDFFNIPSNRLVELGTQVQI